MPAGSVPMPSLRVFFFCTRSNGRERNGLLREELEQRLRSLEQNTSLSLGFATCILPGRSVVEETIRHLHEADIILLLVTPTLLTPEHYNSQEMQIIRQRTQAGEVHVIPILLTPASGLKETWLGELKALPVSDQPKPVSRWSDRGMAFANILEGIRTVILSIQERHNQQRSYLSLIGEPDRIHSDTMRREGVVQDISMRLLREDITALVLSGIGGSGKSTLAHLVYEHVVGLRLAGKSAFTGKVFWLTIEVGTTLNDIAATLLKALHQSFTSVSHTHLSIQPRELALQLFTILDHAREPHLIILDQFERLLDTRGEAYLPDVAEWLHLLKERPCHCRFLLTSRAWPTHVQTALPVYLQEYPARGLEITEGIALLQSLHMVASPQALETVVRRWQGHPKALSSLARLLKYQQKSLDDFLMDYQSIEGEGDVFSFLDYIYSHQLDETQRNLLFALAIFREPMSLYAAQAVISDDQWGSTATFEEALEKLLALRLLEREQERYQPHSLIAEYVLSSLSKGDEPARREAVHQAHMHAARYYQQQFTLTHSAQDRQRRLSGVHDLIEAIWHLCRAEQYHQAYTLMRQEHLFTDLQRRGGSMKLLELYRLLFPLEQWQPTLSQSAHIRAELGSIYHHLGLKEEARVELEQALPLFEAVDEAAGLVFALNTLGEVYRASSIPARAIACYEQALISGERVQGDEGMQLKGITLNNLGSAYHTLKQLDRAISYYEQALSFHLLDRSEEAVTRNNLGQLYESLKDGEKAYRYYKQALSGFQQIGDRRGEATVLMNLGSLWRKRGEIEQAFSCYDRSAYLFQEIGDRWGEVRVLRNMANLHRHQKNYRNALACLFHASDLLEPLYSPHRGEVEELIALLRNELSQDVFEELAAEVRSQSGQIVEKAFRGVVQPELKRVHHRPDMAPAARIIQSPDRTGAFICYSSADRKYLEEFRAQLAYSIRAWNLSIWDNTQTAPGGMWREETEKALRSAKVAILLVSTHFFASDTIMHDELPVLLQSAKEAGVILMPVILRHCPFEHSELAEFRSINPSSRPLETMSSAQRNKVWYEVADQVRKILNNEQKESVSVSSLLTHSGSDLPPSLSHVRENASNLFPSSAQRRSETSKHAVKACLPACDICIICAMEEEVKTFITQTTRLCQVPFHAAIGPHTKREYRYATIQNNKGEPLTIYITWPPRYGPEETSLHFKAALEELKPRFTAMTGICAGDKTRVALGDIVIAECAFHADTGKIVLDGKLRPQRLYETRTYEPDSDLLQFIRLFDAWEPVVSGLVRPISKRQQRDWLLSTLLQDATPGVGDIPLHDLEQYAPDWRRIVDELQKGTRRYLNNDGALSDKEKVRQLFSARDFPFTDPAHPRRLIAPMASSSAVRADNPFEEMRKPVRGTIAVDMEGATFYRTVADFRGIRALLVKGISDYADIDKDDSYHQYAASVSVIYILSFIREFVNSERF